MGFALSRTIVYWGFDCAEDSIPFTRSTSPTFILNGLPLRYSSGDSNSHNGFNELHLRSDVLTLCSDLCASVPIVESAVAAFV
jgi:hypothetical protein